MYDYEKYGIEVGQRWYSHQSHGRSLGSSVLVVSVEDFKDCGDVVVYCETSRNTRRLDAFKLTYRYSLE